MAALNSGWLRRGTGLGGFFFGYPVGAMGRYLVPWYWAPYRPIQQCICIVDDVRNIALRAAILPVAVGAVVRGHSRGPCAKARFR